MHIVKGRGLPLESGGLLERALSGAGCDPYVITSVPNSFGADVAITRPKAADSNPDFFERFFLYVEDPQAPGAALELTVKDKNLLRGDDVIGTCRLPLSELRAEEKDGVAMPPVLEWGGTLDIVVSSWWKRGDERGIELELIDRLHIMIPQSPSGKPSGSIELELQLVSVGDGEEEAAGEEADDEVVAAAAAAAWGPGPKSVLAGIDWNVLGQRMGGQAMGLGRYQFACFLTNEV